MIGKLAYQTLHLLALSEALSAKAALLNGMRSGHTYIALLTSFAD